jgi:hypothetical protein
MQQDFIEKNKNEIIRIINVVTVLFALLIGFNIGSNSTKNEIRQKEDRIKELNSYIEIDEKEHQEEILKVSATCDQKINDAKLFEKQNKDKAFEDYKLICQQMKCNK